MRSSAPAAPVANVVLAVAVGIAVYVVLRTPSLRRAIWQAARTGVTSTLPGFLAARGSRGVGGVRRASVRE